MIPATAGALLRRLNELRDVRLGLPITSHRRGVGKVVVASKKAFRLTLQPFVNELLRKQAEFNETAIETLKVLASEISSLESAVLSFRAGQDARIKQLEAEVERLRGIVAETPRAQAAGQN
jgi:predicted RecB family endonuclease